MQARSAGVHLCRRIRPSGRVYRGRGPDHGRHHAKDRHLEGGSTVVRISTVAESAGTRGEAEPFAPSAGVGRARGSDGGWRGVRPGGAAERGGVGPKPPACSRRRRFCTGSAPAYERSCASRPGRRFYRSHHLALRHPGPPAAHAGPRAARTLGGILYKIEPPPTARPAGGTGAGTDSALTHTARPNRGPGPHAKARDTPGPAFSTYVYFRKAIILPRKQAHRMTGRSYRKRIRRGHPNAHRRSSTENHWSRCAPR